MSLNHKKSAAGNLTITGLVLAGILAIPSLGHAEQVTLTYDALDRLTSAVDGDGTVIQYSYDAAGNRTSHIVQAAITNFTLTVAPAGTGSGTVEGGGSYPPGATVTLTATAAVGSTFTGWSPSPCAASFTMPAADLTCTATFTLNTCVLTLNMAGTGSGTVSGGGSYAAGTTVVLTATPATGSTFAGWSPSPCAASFTMPANALTCTATFTGGVATLSINDVSKAEGNSGTTTANFTVTLAPASTGTVTVKYATANNGSAVAGSDYTAARGTLTFVPGQTSKTVAVKIIGDKVKEANETYVVNLSAPTSATLADSQGLGTILNDDGPVLRMTDVSKAEGNAGTSAAIFKVTLSPASSVKVTVNYATADGTALTGSDYTATSGTLTFAPGQTSKTVTVSVTGDTLVESNETFFVNLTTASGATLFDSQGVGTLLNDDGPVIRINDVRKTEGNSGTTTVNFTVSLAPASTGSVTVKYATANGTALTGGDYTATSGTLTFVPGQTSKTVAVIITGDKVKEANETFFVNLTAPTGATLFDSQGLGTILNDD